MPTEVQERISAWAKNPAMLPHPICENRGLLNMVDLDVWYWSHRIAPVTNRGHFFMALWDMFNIPGNWRQLAGPGNWNSPNTMYLRSSTEAHWEWPNGLSTMDPICLACWLGTIAGVIPDWDQNWIEPYATRQNTHKFYSSRAREAHEQTVSKKATKQGTASTSLSGFPYTSPFFCRQTRQCHQSTG